MEFKDSQENSTLYNISAGRGENRMAYRISDDCISCGACEAECPVGAISAAAGKFVINPEICISCGTCASVCPVGAPSQE